MLCTCASTRKRFIHLPARLSGTSAVPESRPRPHPRPELKSGRRAARWARVRRRVVDSVRVDGGRSSKGVQFGLGPHLSPESMSMSEYRVCAASCRWIDVRYAIISIFDYLRAAGTVSPKLPYLLTELLVVASARRRGPCTLIDTGTLV